MKVWKSYSNDFLLVKIILNNTINGKRKKLKYNFGPCTLDWFHFSLYSFKFSILVHIIWINLKIGKIIINNFHSRKDPMWIYVFKINNNNNNKTLFVSKQTIQNLSTFFRRGPSQIVTILKQLRSNEEEATGKLESQ